MVNINSINLEWLKSVSLQEFIDAHKNSNVDEEQLIDLYNKNKQEDGISTSNDGEVSETGSTTTGGKRNRGVSKNDSGNTEGTNE